MESKRLGCVKFGGPLCLREFGDLPLVAGENYAACAVVYERERVLVIGTRLRTDTGVASVVFDADHAHSRDGETAMFRCRAAKSDEFRE